MTICIIPWFNTFIYYTIIIFVINIKISSYLIIVIHTKPYRVSGTRIPTAAPVASMCAGAPAASELSAYERERLSNIQRNNEVLEKMGLAPGGGLVPAIRKSAPAKAKRKPVHVEAEPQRRSGRIRKALAPDVYVVLSMSCVEFFKMVS